MPTGTPTHIKCGDEEFPSIRAFALSIHSTSSTVQQRLAAGETPEEIRDNPRKSGQRPLSRAQKEKKQLADLHVPGWGWA